MAKLTFSLNPNESLDFPLDGERIRLGRHPANEIVIDNSWISSFHAEFHRMGDTLQLRDLHSSNGTSLNGVRISEADLRDGDRISFGQLEAVYEAGVSGDMPASVAVQPPGAKAAPVPVVTRSMAPPSATIAYDAARKEAAAELEILQKKLTEANAAVEKAVVERRGAEDALAASHAARTEASAALEGVKQELEQARAAVAEEAGRLATAREEAAREAAEWQVKGSALAGEHARLRNELSETEGALTTARSALEQTGNELAQHRKIMGDFQREAADAGGALETARETLAKFLTEQETAQSAGAEILLKINADRAAATAALRQAEAGAGEGRAALEVVQEEIRAAHAILDKAKKDAEGLEQKAAQWHREAGLAQEREAAAKTELAVLQEKLANTREETAAGERSVAERLQVIGKLEIRQNILAGKVTRWQEQEAAAARCTAALLADQAAASTLRREMEECQVRRTTARAATDEATDRLALVQGETQTLTARLEVLRRETEGAEALNSKVTDLRQQQAEAERRLEFLTDRLTGMADAPDPNWGTVHSLALSFIRKLDLIEDLMAHLATQPEAAGTLSQLEVLRAGLLDILKEYTVEAYSLEPGTVIDVAARKRIQIVETLSEGCHDGTRIVRTYRPGYVCMNGDLGISTLLRKADVAVAIPVG